MSSRFFRGDSDSEDDESSSSGEDAPQKQVPARFARGEDSDGDEPEQKRVVKSIKEKRLDELQDIVTAIQGYIKANQWSKIQADFDKLNKAMAKVQAINKEVPKSYIKTLATLDDACAKAIEDKDKKKLVKADAQALAIMKSTLKKNNSAYESNIADYRKNAEEESEEDDEESDEDVDKPVAPPAKPAAAKPAEKKNKFFPDPDADESGSEDDSDFPPDSDTESDESSADEGPGQGKGKWFLKKAPVKETPVAETKKKKEDKKVQKPKKADEPAASAKEPSSKELSPEQLDKKLQELVELRGRKSTARMGQVEQLEALIQHAKTDDKIATILAHVLDAQFDVTASVATHMSVNMWKSTLANLNKLVQILERNASLVLAESENDRVSGEEGTVASGNLLAFVERLDDEFIKSLQNIDDPHTHEYVQRLQDEQGFVDLAERVQSYYGRVDNKRRAARVAARRLEHLYYKHERDVRALAKAAAAKETKPDAAKETKPDAAKETKPDAAQEAKPDGVDAPAADAEERVAPLRDLIQQLAYLVYGHGDERLRARTMLMHIYHHALHDRFYEARDMMLMSHLQETIHQMDIPTQILFNRTMVQLGLCAFRNNLISEAHSCLADICGGGRVKELLAQGITNTQRFGEKNAEQEKIERKRLVPFHMHLNLELLECVHLISAMLLEVPNMAQNPFDLKKKIISRAFRRLLDYFDRQVFTGPPENNRDFVAAASKALSTGDWRTCEALLLSLKVWVLMPNAENVKAAIRKRIQEEGLRTYLFTYSNFYDSMSLSELSAMFELSANAIHSIVSKMIINEELYASWDQPTASIIMQRAEPTKLQYLALQFAEKAAVFVENNERLLDNRTGGYGYNKAEGGKPAGKERGQWQEGGGYYNRQQYHNQYQQGAKGRQYGQQRHQDGYARHPGSYQGGGGGGGGRGGGRRYDGGDRERSDYGGYHRKG